jgi:hypothetical protein
MHQSGNAKADAKAAKAYYKASRPLYKKKRVWLIGIILLIVVIMVASSGGGGDDNSDNDTASDTSDSNTDDTGDSGGSAEEKPNKALKVTAARILKDFEDNEAAADGKYKGKTLQITGVVEKVDTEIFDDSEYVVQVSGGGQFEIWTVNCDDQSSGEVSALAKGDDIVVAGEFEDGGDLGVELKACKIQ